MPLTTHPTPFGLRDVKIKPFAAGTETPGTAVDLPVVRTFSFSSAEDSEELRGDDGIAAIHGLGTSVDWELEAGGISLEAAKAMFAGTITETGTTPNQVKTWERLDNESNPYFQVEGQAISDTGGDVHVVLYKAKVTGELSGEFSDGAFWLSGASGRAVGKTADRKLYKFIQNETETPIA